MVNKPSWSNSKEPGTLLSALADQWFSVLIAPGTIRRLSGRKGGRGINFRVLLLVFFTFFMSSFFLSACSVSSIQVLREVPPNQEFDINAPIECLYNKGVKHVSSYMGYSEPQFKWFIDQDKSYAWFLQPLTLIELYKKGLNITEVKRKQTYAASTFGQGDDLLTFLKSNPCKLKK